MPSNKEGSRWGLAGAMLAAAGVVAAAWGMDAMRRERTAAQLHRDMVEILLNALTAGDPVTARHSRRVADLSYALAQAAGMHGAELRTLRIAALLHDMGKIDDRFFHIIHSRKPLTRQQRAEIKGHPHESAHILAPLETEHPGIQQIVSSHHECWDGSGYPRGLQDAEIPLGARIISVADAFDAMTQPRKYRDALPLEKALS
jgi:putative nucleotidyltransferase with HDIG domain